MPAGPTSGLRGKDNFLSVRRYDHAEQHVREVAAIDEIAG